MGVGVVPVDFEKFEAAFFFLGIFAGSEGSDGEFDRAVVFVILFNFKREGCVFAVGHDAVGRVVVNGREVEVVPLVILFVSLLFFESLAEDTVVIGDVITIFESSRPG